MLQKGVLRANKGKQMFSTIPAVIVLVILFAITAFGLKKYNADAKRLNASSPRRNTETERLQSSSGASDTPQI